MRLVFQIDYEEDTDEDMQLTTRLITEELTGWAGVRRVRCHLYNEEAQQLLLMQEYLREAPET